MMILIMTGHTVLTKIGGAVTPTVICTLAAPTLIAPMVTVPMVTALMKIDYIVKLPMLALRLLASDTQIAMMFMMSPMTIATMTQHVPTNLTIHIVLSNVASLQNPLVPHHLSLAEFLLPPPNLP